jgi:hypothetical protein
MMDKIGRYSISDEATSKIVRMNLTEKFITN